MRIWTLKKQNEKRFRLGHPWVFSNELSSSPKSATPGEEIELRSEQGDFLARGFGNPHSLIAFREMTRNIEVTKPFAPEILVEKLKVASYLRSLAGLKNFSHRLVFGEADLMPGLIVDRFVLKNYQNKHSQCFVIQAHTAGMNLKIKEIIRALELLVEFENSIPLSHTAFIVNNDTKSRKLEGIEPEPAYVATPIENIDLEHAQIAVKHFASGEEIFLKCDLIGGQKTGFFLDQSANIELTMQFLKNYLDLHPSKKTIRVLDICCYVGQWGTQLAHFLKANQRHAEVVCVDASESALKLAEQNITSQDAHCTTLKRDVLTPFIQDATEKGDFDIVICDPPAFIKNRKDYPQGEHAYMKLNSEAMTAVKEGGIFVTCSCSGLLTDEDFESAIHKASLRLQKRSGLRLQFLARGRQGADHPILAHFAEGKYLKAWIGSVNN